MWPCRRRRPRRPSGRRKERVHLHLLQRHVAPWRPGRRTWRGGPSASSFIATSSRSSGAFGVKAATARRAGRAPGRGRGAGPDPPGRAPGGTIAVGPAAGQRPVPLSGPPPNRGRSRAEAGPASPRRASRRGRARDGASRSRRESRAGRLREPAAHGLPRSSSRPRGGSPSSARAKAIRLRRPSCEKVGETDLRTAAGPPRVPRNEPTAPEPAPSGALPRRRAAVVEAGAREERVDLGSRSDVRPAARLPRRSPRERERSSPSSVASVRALQFPRRRGGR